MVTADKKSKDTFILEEYPAEIVFEDSEVDSTSSPVIKGVFLKANTLSRNGRFYSENIVRNFIDQINSGKQIITMWTNHYPMDETLATVGKVFEAWYEEATGLAWFKAKVASTSAGRDIVSLLKDKFIEGVSIRYYPVDIKEATIKGKTYFNVLKGELFGIDFVATRTGVPVAKIRSISSEELVEFERAFNGEEEIDMSEVEKIVTNEVKDEDIKEVEIDTKNTDVSTEEVKIDTKPEESKVEDKKEEEVEKIIEDSKVEDKKDESTKEESKVEDKKEDKVEEVIEDPKVEDKTEEKVEDTTDWKAKYLKLQENVNVFIGKLAEVYKESAVASFDIIKEKKMYQKIMAEIDAITITTSDDIVSAVDNYKEAVDNVVASYKELLEELESSMFSNSEAKEKLLKKETESVEKVLPKAGADYTAEMVALLNDYGVELAEEDLKLMESK
jgi:hypothetical protein